MKLVDDIGLAAAEQLERTVGPFLALPAYKKLLVRVPDTAYSARVALGALRCAGKLGDDRELEAVADYWSTLSGGGDHQAIIIAFCKTLMRDGRKWPAVKLARAEAEREGKARAFYLLGRCLELAGDGDGAFEAFGEAAKRADKEQGEADVALAARAKRVERMMGDRNMAPLALADAQAVDAANAPAHIKFAIGLARLRAPSRFVRTSGLSLLEFLARDPTSRLGALSIKFAAEHADNLGDALTPLEADRIAAAIGHLPDEAAKQAALSRLQVAQVIASATGEAQNVAIQNSVLVAPEIAPLVQRAQAIQQGQAAGDPRQLPSASLSERLRASSHAQEALLALTSGRHRDAAVALHAAAEIVERESALSPPLWVAAIAALEANDTNAKDAATRLAMALLASAIMPPLRGFSALASAFERAGRHDLAANAVRAAVAAKEPSALLLHGEILRNQGWALALRGEREQAIAVLREAREHLQNADKSS